MPMLVNCICLICLLSIIFVNGEWISYQKVRGKLILLHHLKEQDEYEILHEGADHSDHLTFQYDGVSNFLQTFFKLWNSVEVTVHCKDDEFTMRTADTVAEIRPNNAISHEHGIVEHLQDNIQHFWDDVNHFMFFHDDKSVELNPIDQHFVRVYYHGSKPYTTFSVTVNDAVDWKFPFCFLAGVIMLIFSHPISRRVNSLYFLCAFPVGIISSPYTLVYMCSRLFPWTPVSYIVRCVGFGSVTFMMYNLTHLTLEEIFHLPLFYILCGAVFIEYFFHPVTKFVNASQRLLGYVQFLWAVRIGAGLLLIQSTQSWKASIFLLTMCAIIHVSLLTRNQQVNSRNNSQELEYVTTANSS